MTKLPVSSIGRTIIYLAIFIVGAVLRELLNPALFSTGAALLTLSMLAGFVLIGVLFASERYVVSRVTSAATLFILGLIALRFGHASLPDAYLLAAALGVAILGTQPVLHRKVSSAKKMALHSVLTVVIALVIAFAFVYGMTVLDRSAL